VACFSLTGIPLTVGFFAKLYLIGPALQSHLYGLAILLVINAAISAGYYLWIVGSMFVRPAPEDVGSTGTPAGDTDSAADARVIAAATVRALTVSQAPAALEYRRADTRVARRLRHPAPILIATIISAAGALALGTALPLTNWLVVHASAATAIDARPLLQDPDLPQARNVAPPASATDVARTELTWGPDRR
jgi:formate hydrogenlyase subunit 3/multisubunit Na+/H+ antiporter MnhD subunit